MKYHMKRSVYGTQATLATIIYCVWQYTKGYNEHFFSIFDRTTKRNHGIAKCIFLHYFSPCLMSYLSVGGGFNIRVARFTNDVIDVAQGICRDVRKSSGAVWGEIAIGMPCVTKISWALDDHCCRPESLKKKGFKHMTRSIAVVCDVWVHQYNAAPT